ncbi:MAG: CPBP family intramembrane glutamic endopeptidase [Bacteroidota bacterium]
MTQDEQSALNVSLTPDNISGVEPPQSWIAKNGFPYWLLATAWIGIVFVMFNIVGGIVMAVLAAFTVDDPSNMELLLAAMQENLDVMFIGNTSGQIVSMALATFIVVLLTSVRGQRNLYLRFQLPPRVLLYIGASLLLFLVGQPLVQFAGWLNSFVPVPEFMRELTDQMVEMMTRFLTSDTSVFVALFHIALVPAVCEELLFRGFFMRSLEKSTNVWLALVISSAVFSLFHLDISGLLPRFLLGLFLGYITLKSNSIIPAMVGHFTNNALYVILAKSYPELASQESLPDVTATNILILIGGIAATAGVIYFMHLNRIREEETEIVH